MVAVIGDIHGCYYTLIELYNKIIDKYPGIKVYTVGDLVDRGNNSYQVIEFIKKNNIQFTAGNHDYMFYHFFKEPTSIFAKSWVFNGNEMTLDSYDSNEASVFEHIEFIKEAPLYYNLSDCFISHAGISSKYKSMNVDLEENIYTLFDLIKSDYNNERGVLWTRDRLLNIGKIQVVGHTKHKDITYDEDSNAVYIDTGACVGNKLSAVVIENSQIITTFEVGTKLNDII